LVDFKKLLGRKQIIKPLDPLEIFGDLDKESGKEYFRPPQKSVLEEWYSTFRAQKDVIIKLHTGQGKTLIGLLILQSYLNEGKGPAVYICPNNYLVNQIVDQAKAFGIKTTQFYDTKPPQEFLNSEAILITNCNKLFNGKSVFGVRGSRRAPIHLGAIVIDDAHKCLEIIRNSFSIIVKKKNGNRNNPIYSGLWGLFEDSLKRQAPGTCSDILDEAYCLMAVPFWSWYDKRDEVLQLLSEHKESDELLFVWDLLKNHLNECYCIFSGVSVEITPRLLPVDLIPSFSEAEKRIFLSATLTDDTFLVRDMGIAPESVTNPLSSGDVKYSGERLVILPTLLDTNLERENIISWISGLAAKNGDFGVVAITPSFYHTNDWKSYGGKVTNVKRLYDNIDQLKTKVRNQRAKKVLVLVNEYDGIDLPDSTCRILVLDSLPSYSTLMDSYIQEVQPFSSITRRQLAQRVEQGMGRAIRGSSDWCIVVIAGNNLTDFLSDRSKRVFLSNEAQLQIEIGEELIQEMKEEEGRLFAIEKLVKQCLKRDDSWKEYYKDRMSRIVPDAPKKEYLDRAIIERNAEILCRQGQYAKAVEKLQRIIATSDATDKGWLLQLMATYLYPVDQKESMNKQLRAHIENSNLFRPETGVAYSKLTSTGTRVSRILDWIKKHDSHNTAIVEITTILGALSFGSPTNSFEKGIHELGQALGFISQRPEKETGEGSDNLWNIQGKIFWLIECKNNVKQKRRTITKSETGQLNNSIGWFKKCYEKEKGLPIFIHSAKKLGSGAYVNETFYVIGIDELKKLRENTLGFFKALTGTPFDDLSSATITEALKEYHLDTNNLPKEYLQRGE